MTGGPLAALTVDIRAAITDDDLKHVAGGAAKLAATTVAEQSLGADKSFSGFRRKVPLKSGYDLTGTGVELNLRPEGLWKLADTGTKRSGVILPRAARRRRRTGHRPAVTTPAGTRYVSRYKAGRFRGFKILDRLETELDATVLDAVDRALLERLTNL